jgi:hypothetical protein
MKTYDALIRWPDGEKHLQKIIKQKGFCLKNKPLSMDFNKNRMGIIQEGKIKCIFNIKDFKQIENASIPSGKINGDFKITKGYFFNIHKIKITELKSNIHGFHAFGALRYYDLKTGKPFNKSGSVINNKLNYVDKIKYQESDTLRSKPFNFKDSSILKNNAEKALVNAYVKYCNIENHVLHPYLKTDHHYADLFDKTKWRLIEAKGYIDRKVIREAVGQLLDYKRYFNRKPSMGILLPEKPSKSIIDFLKYYKITVIWATASNSFNDSSDGLWSRLYRNK